MEGDIKITVHSLNYTVKAGLRDEMFLEMYGKYSKCNVGQEEFNRVLELGLRKSVYEKINSYYRFANNLKVEISDQELYELYSAMFG